MVSRVECARSGTGYGLVLVLVLSDGHEKVAYTALNHYTPHSVILAALLLRDGNTRSAVLDTHGAPYLHSVGPGLGILHGWGQG